MPVTSCSTDTKFCVEVILPACESAARKANSQTGLHLVRRFSMHVACIVADLR